MSFSAASAQFGETPLTPGRVLAAIGAAEGAE